MKFGLTQEQYNLILTTVVSPLSQAGARVYVFGSRARGKHHAFSDIDLLVEAPEGKVSQSLISKCRQEIEESNLPIKVDLVLSYELASSYKESVHRDKIEF